jgi:hypothetical protein
LSAQPRRRWFQFSLTGMLLLVTVIAVTLGWELSFIRERRALFELMIERKAVAEKDSELMAQFSKMGARYLPEVLPWWRRWLGDEPVGYIGLNSSTIDLSDEAMRLFPEAQITDSTIPLQPRTIQYWSRDTGEVK